MTEKTIPPLIALDDEQADGLSTRYVRAMWLRADIHVPAGCRLHRQPLRDDALSQLSKTQRCDAR